MWPTQVQNLTKPCIAYVLSANDFWPNYDWRFKKKNRFYSSEQLYLIRITFYFVVQTVFEICPINWYTLSNVTKISSVRGNLTLCTFVWVCLVNCKFVIFCFSICLSIYTNIRTRKEMKKFLYCFILTALLNLVDIFELKLDKVTEFSLLFVCAVTLCHILLHGSYYTAWCLHPHNIQNEYSHLQKHKTRYKMTNNLYLSRHTCIFACLANVTCLTYWLKRVRTSQHTVQGAVRTQPKKHWILSHITVTLTHVPLMW
jgi:hypothetical protein